MKKKRIDQILFEKKFVESRTKGQALIMSGSVYVGENKVFKSGELYNDNINIKIRNNSSWVSRGALKLEPIILKNNVKIDKKICMDVGSSTGGFTQVLLKYNAKKIYSIDVGYGQLHEKIKANKKVISLERKNAKYLTKQEIKDTIDLIVCDASFISLKKVIKIPIKFLKKKGEIIALIKPQFEANRAEVKGGVIKDASVHERICMEIKDWFFNENNFKVCSIIESSIKGPKGNKEFFIYAIKND
ncbi:MAG: TlyA family rRNA (cytidine-2'-O)-methyltransferase [Pelagibacteraceae bacterium]|nr:TlyA family rRNA (cytidine-2'-O)-methyltransferase [Pelagibacteraceae bacterium]